MKSKFYSILSSVLLTGAALSADAQTTGSFTDSVSFMGQQRRLSCYVPTTYNPAQPHKLMICLHGLGDNSNNYRNALINSLGIQNTFQNTIFICPDGGSDAIKDFYTPAGDEGIIEEAIHYATNNYNVDTTQIILQGFSLGGRSALRYGLDNPSRFEGLLLNTPAVQGTKEAVTPGTYNYANATGMPIFVTHGALDILYGAPIDSMMEQLILNDAKVVLNRFPSLNHSIPQLSQTPMLPAFFDGVTSTVPQDAAVERVYIPRRSCDAPLNIQALIRNTGIQPLDSVKLSYDLGGTPQTYTWTGTLNSYEHAIVPLPQVTANPGAQTVTVSVVDVDATPDPVTANNSATAPYEYAATSAALPFSEGFEGTNFNSLVYVTAGDAISMFELDNTVAYTGQASLFTFNSILVFDNRDRKEVLYTPVMNLPAATQPELSFDYTYNYHMYTPPYFVDTTVFADTLEVAVSTDCGGSFQTIWRMGGADLATYSAPIMNPLNLNAVAGVPSGPGDWRHVTLPLAAYAGNAEAVVRISYISGLGGWINIDNILVSPTTDVEDVAPAAISVYPNPANDRVIIASQEELLSAAIYDVTGKLVRHLGFGSGKQQEIATADLMNGMYILKLETKKGTFNTKLQIAH